MLNRCEIEELNRAVRIGTKVFIINCVVALSILITVFIINPKIYDNRPNTRGNHSIK